MQILNPEGKTKTIALSDEIIACIAELSADIDSLIDVMDYLQMTKNTLDTLIEKMKKDKAVS